MADYVESILPSGRGIRLEKITTKQYRQIQLNTAKKMGDRHGTTEFGALLSDEALLVSLRGTTAPLEWKYVRDDNGEIIGVDVDAMLDAAPAALWQQHGYLSLITEGPTSIDAVLPDPSDYTAALGLLNKAVLAGGGQSTGGKFRVASVG